MYENLSFFFFLLKRERERERERERGGGGEGVLKLLFFWRSWWKDWVWLCISTEFSSNFFDKWNCTFSHRQNGTDWAVPFVWDARLGPRINKKRGGRTCCVVGSGRRLGKRFWTNRRQRLNVFCCSIYLCKEKLKRSNPWILRANDTHVFFAYLPTLPVGAPNLQGNTYRGLFKIFFINFIIFGVGNIRKAFRSFSESIQTLSKMTFLFFFLDVSRFLYSGGWQVCLWMSLSSFSYAEVNLRNCGEGGYGYWKSSPLETRSEDK